MVRFMGWFLTRGLRKHRLKANADRFWREYADSRTEYELMRRRMLRDDSKGMWSKRMR